MLLPITLDEAQELELAPWGTFARDRAADLDAGRDPSFAYVLRPTISSLVGSPDQAETLLDIGCGVGRLTVALEHPHRAVIALDPDARSLEYAKQVLAPTTQVIQQNLSQYAESEQALVDVCVATMVMQDVIDLDAFVRDVRSVVRPNGRFVFAITNPHYWPTYRGYADRDWFSYDREIFIRASFATSTVDYGVETLQIHRPLETYLAALAQAGMRVVELSEPMLSEVPGRAFPPWSGPHFLFGVAQRIA